MNRLNTKSKIDILFSDTLGYNAKDVDGALAPQLEKGRGIAGSETRWESTVDCQKCCQQLNASGFEVRNQPHVVAPFDKNRIIARRAIF